VIESPPSPEGRSDPSSERRGRGDSPVPAVDPDDEVIDEAGEESFPASDSPSTWAGPPSESR